MEAMRRDAIQRQFKNETEKFTEKNEDIQK
jgi:hypothetical protein